MIARLEVIAGSTFMPEANAMARMGSANPTISGCKVLCSSFSEGWLYLVMLTLRDRA